MAKPWDHFMIEKMLFCHSFAVPPHQQIIRLNKCENRKKLPFYSLIPFQHRIQRDGRSFLLLHFALLFSLFLFFLFVYLFPALYVCAFYFHFFPFSSMSYTLFGFTFGETACRLPWWIILKYYRTYPPEWANDSAGFNFMAEVKLISSCGKTKIGTTDYLSEWDSEFPFFDAIMWISSHLREKRGLIQVITWIFLTRDMFRSFLLRTLFDFFLLIENSSQKTTINFCRRRFCVVRKKFELCIIWH